MSRVKGDTELWSPGIFVDVRASLSDEILKTSRWTGGLVPIVSSHRVVGVHWNPNIIFTHLLGFPTPKKLCTHPLHLHLIPLSRESGRPSRFVVDLVSPLLLPATTSSPNIYPFTVRSCVPPSTAYITHGTKVPSPSPPPLKPPSASRAIAMAYNWFSSSSSRS
ncbi:hypothetical protein FA13DRAFT_1787308 [Coprinellus micaceus]|uniref:Uncharacterized protein n=1 Tax=Coprinellus micaceus TaxID=71717 RepID=A0A4Y7TSY9_COPMI|nr:hypothetical protein FA13DRAFT_1787308 [Coprinellus micaceus]